jgi:hypothetical protein
MTPGGLSVLVKILSGAMRMWSSFVYGIRAKKARIRAVCRNHRTGE